MSGLYYGYLKEAESSSVEAHLEEEYLRWIDGTARVTSGFFFGFPGIQNASKTSGFGAEPQALNFMFKSGVRLVCPKNVMNVTP